MKKVGSKTKEALKWNTGLKLFIQCFTIIMSIILARLLTPVDFGIMATGMIIIRYANTITDFGFFNALIQIDEIEDKLINSVFTFNLTFSIILALISYFSADLIARFFDSPESKNVIRLLSFIFLSTAFTGTMFAINKRVVKHKIVAKTAAFASIVNHVSAIVMALMGFDYWALVIANLLGQVVTMGALFRISDWKPKIQYDHKLMKSIYNFGIWNFIRSQVFYLNNYIMHIFIGSTMPIQALGLFDKAFEISARPNKSLAKPINGVMFSSFSRMKHSKKQLNDWLINLLTIQTIFLLPVHVGLYVISRYFVVVALGDQWIEIIIPLKFLLAARAMLLYTASFATFLIAVGKFKSYTIRNMIASLVLVIFCGILFPYGLKGICTSFLCFSLFSLSITFHLLMQITEIRMASLVKSIGPYFLGNVFMGMVVTYLSNVHLNEATIVNLILLCITGIVSYVIWTILLNYFKGKDLLFPLNRLKSK